MIKSVFYRSPHNYDVNVASDEAAIPVDGHGESMTVQSQAEDADINVMMRRFGVTGQLPQGMRVPEYADFSVVSDFRSALHAVMDAQDNFMKLDAAVRQRFDNDPQLFLDFCSDPANVPELAKLGLAREGYGDIGKSGDVRKASGAAGAASGSGSGESQGSASGGS